MTEAGWADLEKAIKKAAKDLEVALIAHNRAIKAADIARATAEANLRFAKSTLLFKEEIKCQ